MVGTFFLVLITFGLTLVLITWRKDIKYALLYREAKLVEAEKVLLTDHHHQQVHEESVVRLQSELFFINKKTSMCGTKPCNSSESSATSTRAS